MHGRSIQNQEKSMNRKMIYHTKQSCILAVVAVMLVCTAGCRRDLWVYTDDYRQVELCTDWSQATDVPGGMTWWFINDNLSGRTRHETTAEVAHTWLNLPRGQYTGFVFDYSPAEYAHIDFVGMTHPDSALVHLLPAADQPLSDEDLYGSRSVNINMGGIPINPETGMHLVASEPELMNADTLHHVTINTGTDGDLILWDESDEYQSKLITQTVYAEPKPVVWKLRVRVYVHGISFMYSVRGSVAGLADGCWLSPLRHTCTSCLQRLDSWDSYSFNNGTGYITTTINTFGLPDMDMLPSPLGLGGQNSRADDDGTPDYNRRLRLNLQFLLRDQATVLNYHFDVGDECITIFEDELVVRIDIPIDFPGGPDLPYVDVKGSAGFGATVTPWEDTDPVDVSM